MSDKPRKGGSGEHRFVVEMRKKLDSIAENTLPRLDDLNHRLERVVDREKKRSGKPPPDDPVAVSDLSDAGRVVLCPACFERIYSTGLPDGHLENCCTHGHGEARCTECGAVKDACAWPWRCVDPCASGDEASAPVVRLESEPDPFPTSGEAKEEKK